MPKHSKPRAGSLQFWPKKRTNRIYPSLKSPIELDKLRILGFAGYKAGMTHAVIIDNKKNSPTQGQEISVPVTVLDCPPLKILGIRAYKKTPDGLRSFTEVWDEGVKRDKDLKRKLVVENFKPEREKTIEKEIDRIKKIRLIVKTNPRKSGIGKKKPEVFELEVSGPNIREEWEFYKTQIGKEIRVKDVFKDGEYIDAVAITKGKGTQGVVKRFGVKIQNRKAKKKRRHVGTLGSLKPRRVLRTVPQAGQMGFFRRTEYNKRILKIGEDGKEINPKSGFLNYGLIESDYIILEGSVPGPRKRLIMFRPAIRPPKISVLSTEIKYIKK